MRVVCAWCRSQLEQGSEPVSHGICLSCFEGLKAAVVAQPGALLPILDDVPAVTSQEEVRPNA